MDISGYTGFYLRNAALVAGTALATFAWSRSGPLTRPLDSRRLDRWFFGGWVLLTALFAGLALRSLSSFHKYFDTAVETEVIANIARGQGMVSAINTWEFRTSNEPESYLAFPPLGHTRPPSSTAGVATVVRLGILCVAAGLPVYRIARESLGSVRRRSFPLAYFLLPTVQLAML